MARLVLLGLGGMLVAVPFLAIGALRGSDRQPRLPGLLSIAASAPMVGVLGTVLGVINAGVALALRGTFEVRPVAAGLAEALSLTALGLAIGVFALWVRTAVQARLARRLATAGMVRARADREQAVS